MKLSYLCKNDLCQQEIILDVYPGDPGRTYGPPEKCYPPEPATFEPEECEHCGTKVDSERVWEMVDDMMDDWDEQLYEREN